MSIHETFCPKNLNRKYGSVANQYIKAKQEGRTIPPRSEKFRKDASIKSSAIRWTDEQKSTHSKRMRKAAVDNPDSYSSSNRGRTKQIIIDNIKLQGQWEVDFYTWAKNNKLNPQRPDLGFPYEYDGTRTYYPDFYIPSIDLYVEVKGYETDKDRAKWRDFPHKLIVLKHKDISSIRNNTFRLKYV